MNIFVLDKNPRRAAQAHCDKHVSKMVVESVQLLSTALRFYNVSDNKLYRSSHQNHPCAIWTRTTKTNFLWLCEFAEELGIEYTFRYARTHKSSLLIPLCRGYSKVLPDGPKTRHAKCMPDYCKEGSVVQSYRNYYQLEKSGIAEWRHSPVPKWYKPD